MELLQIKSDYKIENTPTTFQRFLLNNSFSHRLIAIKGARGTGKTTILQQFGKRQLLNNKTVLYVALDDLFFTNSNLYDLAEHFVINNGNYLLLDEVHKYPNWSREIKLIYDDFPKLNVVFTSSSILDIYRAESDLSRRAVTHILPELSLREFIELESNIELPTFTLEEILANHKKIATEITKKIKPVFEFNKYIRYGQYPYFTEGIDEYYNRVFNTINLILDVDLRTVENLDYSHIVKLKKLLYAISTSVPFVPNISKLSEKVELSRPFMIKALSLLEKAHLLYQVHKYNKGISHMAKPEKLYLRNTNLVFTIAKQNALTGNLRETFFMNQVSQTHKINIPLKGDFLINDKYTIEIGGKNKTKKQIADINDAFLVLDNIEVGTRNTIPLWLFGFLY